MQAEFWHQRWASNQIGFHESQVNPLLVAHFEAMALAPGGRVFLPLCGKTMDIDWLLARGIAVAGVELSALAVKQLFERIGTKPVISRSGGMERHSTDLLDVFVGDFFQLSASDLDTVNAVFDRAALIALPQSMRPAYATHLRRLTAYAPQLLVTLEYDQQCMDGPPFSVDVAEVHNLYADRSPVLLSRETVPDGLKGKCPASEAAWKV